MKNNDIRWQQRFNNFKKALARLTSAIELSRERDLSDLEQQGLIQGFEFTFDIAWKTIKDFVIEKGYQGDIEHPLPVITEAGKREFINEKNWRLMYQSRNKTSHAYDEEVADEVAEKIITVYHDLFIQLETRLEVERLT